MPQKQNKIPQATAQAADTAAVPPADSIEQQFASRNRVTGTTEIPTELEQKIDAINSKERE